MSSLVLRHADRIAADALVIFPQLDVQGLDREYSGRLVEQLLQLLAFAVHDARLDGRQGHLARLSTTSAERPLGERHLFSLALAIERTVLNELAVDESLGAATEVWGAVVQMVRRASFDVLAEFVERLRETSNTITDPLTGARTRAFFNAALETECDRADRFGDRLGLIVIRLDAAAAIDRRLGLGVSEKILQRLAILVRQYFRRQDLVARFSDDAVAVLLVRADAAHADDLAERVRATIEDRLESADHRNGESFAVTVSVAVVHAGGAPGAMVDPARLVVDAERALQRAARHGGNRVEVVQSASAIRTPPRSSPSA